MRKVEINYDRVVFINLTEMDRYDGLEEGARFNTAKKVLSRF